MKKTTLLYIVHLFILCLLLPDGFAQQYTAEWHLPEGAKARLGRGKLNNVVFSPDGTRIAVSTSIGIWVYDTQTREAVSLFAEIQTGKKEAFFPSKPPEALMFSADAVLVASAHGNSIYVWDTVTGAAFAMLDEHPDSITAIALSSDSTKLATAGGDWVVRLWDVSTGKFINSLKGHPGAVNAVTFSPDGKTLASAGSSLRLWSADTGELRHADDKDLGSIDRLIFSPDGKTVAGAGGWDRAVHLWDVNTRTHQKTPKGHTGEIRDIAFSPDSGTLVSAGTDAMRLWDVRTGTELKSLPTPQDKIPQPVPPILKLEALNKAYLPRQRDHVHSVRFSEDATKLISVSQDGSLHVWDVETGLYQASFSLGAHSDLIGVLAFSEDGQYLANKDGFEGRLRVWDVENATQHAILTPGQGGVLNPLSELTVSSGIKKIAGRELHGTIHIWDAETVALLSSIPTDRMIRYWRLLLSPDGKFLAGIDIIARNKIEFWQTDPGAPLFTLEGHTGLVTAYTFSPDSKIFATGGEDSTIILSEVETGKRLANLMGYTKKSIRAFAFSADSKTLASASGNKILLWDVNTRKQLNNFDAVKDIAALAFSPDGTMLASGGAGGLIQVWNLVPHPQTQATFSGHQGSINVLRFAPDGKTVASGSGDGTILLWNIER